MARVLLIPGTSQISSMYSLIHLARNLHGDNEIIFAGAEQHLGLAKTAGYTTFDLIVTEDSEFHPIPLHTFESAKNHIDAELELYSQVKPDLIISHHRPTAKLSSKINNIKHGAVISQSLPTDNDIQVWLDPYNQVAQKYGLPITSNLLELIEGNAFTVLQDYVSNSPTGNTTQRYFYSGEPTHLTQNDISSFDLLGHELRTPLSIARNAVQMIIRFKHDNLLKEERLDRYLDIFDKAIKREAKLLETVLSSAKIENENLKLVLEKVNLTDILRKILTELDPFPAEQNIEIVNEVLDELFIYGDEKRVHEICTHVIDNACKYTPSGTITITAMKAEDMTKLSIQDTGLGIEESDMDKLGSKFFRTSGKNEFRQTTGIGLGLYIAYQLTALMNGKITVNSEVGKGTTFDIYLPAYTKQQRLQTFTPPLLVS